MTTTETTKAPEAIEIKPEMKEAITEITAHEGAHAFVSWKLGIPLMKIELSVTEARPSGMVVWNDMRGLTPEIQGISYTAGLAGELFILGEEHVRNSGFKGLRTDSKRLNQLGYVTQEDKAKLLSRALGILTENADEFKGFQALLLEKLEMEVQKGTTTLVLDRDTLQGIGFAEPKKKLTYIQ